MPPTLKRQTTIERARFCDEIRGAYNKEVEACEVGQIAGVEGLVARHHYKSKAATEPGDQALKALIKEIRKDLPKQAELGPRASMFVRYDEDQPQFMQVMLAGVQGTPYESGLFLFDAYVPPGYPAINPSVTHTTKNGCLVEANNGPGGFSPNLHRDSGKVCLSLLGTWDGPGWEPGKSNVYQVLASILWMILGAEFAYYMEPGFGGWEGTSPPASGPHVPEVIEYNEEVMFGTAKYAILDVLKDPPAGFEEVAEAHFRAKRSLVLACVGGWHAKGSPALQARLAPVLAELNRCFAARVLPLAEAEAELATAVAHAGFVAAKLAYLRAKVNAAGGGAEAAKAVPLAWRRLRMGATVTAEVAAAVEAKEAQLATVKAAVAERLQGTKTKKKIAKGGAVAGGASAATEEPKELPVEQKTKKSAPAPKTLGNILAAGGGAKAKK